MSDELIGGSVANKSSLWLWVLFDEDTSTAGGRPTGSVVRAKLLRPGWSSDPSTDVDAVTAYNEGVKISGFDGWWRLAQACDAVVAGNGQKGLTIAKTSLILGRLERTQEDDWGTIQYDEGDFNWGQPPRKSFGV